MDDYETGLLRRQAMRLSGRDLFDAAHDLACDPHWRAAAKAEIRYRAAHLEDVTNPTVQEMYDQAEEKYRRMRGEG